MIYLIKRPGGKIKFSSRGFFFCNFGRWELCTPVAGSCEEPNLTKVKEKSKRKWIKFWIISDAFLLFTLVEKRIFIHQSCKNLKMWRNALSISDLLFIPIHTRMEASKWSVKEDKATFWWRNLKIFGSSQPSSDSAILFVSEQGFQWV